MINVIKKVGRIVFFKIEVWFVLSILLLFFCIAILWTLVLSYEVVYHKNENTKLNNFIQSAGEFAMDVQNAVNNNLNPQLTRFSRFDGLNVLQKDKLRGYVLYSAVNTQSLEPVPEVYLYSLADQKIIKSWSLPFEEIESSSLLSVITDKKKDLKLIHPLLRTDGSVTFQVQAKLISVDNCSQLIFINDNNMFHHSIMLNSDGNFIGPSRPKANNYEYEIKKWKDVHQEEMTIVDRKGNTLETHNITEILLKDYYALVLSANDKYARGDLLHLNDIEEIMVDDAYFDAGDLMFSFRHINSVMVTDRNLKIKFLKTGPWTLQHDIDYHGDGIFTIYGNDVNNSNGVSTIYRYDYKNDSTVSLFSSEEIYTRSQGLHRLLADGQLFVEVQNESLLQMYDSAYNIIWEYVHNTDDNEISSIHWSRFFTDDEMEEYLPNLECGTLK